MARRWLYLIHRFGALAQYCAGDMVAAQRFLSSLGEVAMVCEDPERLAAIRRYVDRIARLAQSKLEGFNRIAVINLANMLRNALEQPDYRWCLRDEAAWLGGAA